MGKLKSFRGPKGEKEEEEKALKGTTTQELLKEILLVEPKANKSN